MGSLPIKVKWLPLTNIVSGSGFLKIAAFSGLMPCFSSNQPLNTYNQQLRYTIHRDNCIRLMLSENHETALIINKLIIRLFILFN